MKPRLARTKGVAAGACALLLAACGQAPRGYGVVLWSDGNTLPAGAVIHVIEESSIEDHYLVRSAAGDRREEPVSVERWRVRVFPDTEQATAFAARYALFVDSYGYAVRAGLPVRAAASATADIVYKLREGEVTKVLERAAQPERIGAYENYWYQVLTEAGVAGYTFGEFLPVFQTSADPQVEAARLHADDPTLEHLLATVWRPEYFRAMVITGRYDLGRFRAAYGLFPDPAARLFRLVTETGTREFRYQAVERVGEGRYVLRMENASSSVRFIVHSAHRVSVSYTAAGRQVTQVFVKLTRDVAESIAAERARRDRLYSDLVERGAVLHSSGYGTIELGPERRYRWHGFQALIPELLPAGLPGTGRVEFRYAPAPEQGGGYDTVITFLFDRDDPAPAAGSTDDPAAAASEDDSTATEDASASAGDAGGPADVSPPVEPAAELTLLAEYDSNGIRLTPAEPDPVTLLATHVSRSPVVMYFSFAAASGGSASDDG